MTPQPNAEHRSIRFRKGNGKWLTDEIASIEALATERLRAGIAFHSIQTGALSLLKIAMEGVSTELVDLEGKSMPTMPIQTRKAAPGSPTP